MTVPPSTNAGLSLASFSSEVSGRMPSSRSSSTPGTGTTSAPSTPSSYAARGEPVAAQRELVLGLARDRRTCRRASRRSAPSEIVHCSGISGLTIRQPSVVECSCLVARGKPRSGLSSTHGARLIDSTPPATTIDASPASIARAGLDRRLEARAAQAVDRRAGDGGRQARQQHRHPRDVAVVLAGAVGVAEDHVVDRRGVEVGRRGRAARGARARRGRRGARAASAPP